MRHRGLDWNAPNPCQQDASRSMYAPRCSDAHTILHRVHNRAPAPTAEGLTAVVTQLQASEPQGPAASGLPSLKSVEANPEWYLADLAKSVAKDRRDATARALYRAALSAACDRFSAHQDYGRTQYRGVGCTVTSGYGLYCDWTRLDSALGTDTPTVEHYVLALTTPDARVIYRGCKALIHLETLAAQADLASALAKRGALDVLVAVVLDERSLDSVLAPAARQGDDAVCCLIACSIRNTVFRTLAEMIVSKKLAARIPDRLLDAVLVDYVQYGDLTDIDFNFSVADAVGLLYQNACLMAATARAILRSPGIISALERYAFCAVDRRQPREHQEKLAGMRLQATAALANLVRTGPVDLDLWKRLKERLVARLSSPPDEEELLGISCAILGGFARALPAVAAELAREGALLALFALHHSQPQGHTGSTARQCIHAILKNTPAADWPSGFRGNILDPTAIAELLQGMKGDFHDADEAPATPSTLTTPQHPHP